jgi:hypothetical protein
MLRTHAFHEPVLPGVVVLEILGASKLALIADDQPALEAIRCADLILSIGY